MASDGLREVALPDGKRVFCRIKVEALALAEQVESYLRHGVEVRPGDTVLDVGANMGLFAVQVVERCEQRVRVLAFEPIPATFEALRHNAERHGAGCITAVRAGMSDRVGKATFAYRPRTTAQSTVAEYADGWRQDVEAMISGIDPKDRDTPAAFRMMRWVPRGVRRAFAEWFYRSEPVECDLTTVSAAVVEHRVERIDLLKIDVEKAELDVLRGIGPEDWPRVRQVAMEVHDIEGRLDAIRALLTRQGLGAITVEQEPMFRGVGIYNLYALRG